MEIQCNLNQQERIAHLLLEIFGDKLYVDKTADRNQCSSKSRTLPSPEDLRGKIIIKVLHRLISKTIEAITDLFDN